MVVLFDEGGHYLLVKQGGKGYKNATIVILVLSASLFKKNKTLPHISQNRYAIGVLDIQQLKMRNHSSLFMHQENPDSSPLNRNLEVAFTLSLKSHDKTKTPNTARIKSCGEQPERRKRFYELAKVFIGSPSREAEALGQQ